MPNVRIDRRYLATSSLRGIDLRDTRRESFAMPENNAPEKSSPSEPASRKPLTPAAQRALAEAEARRKTAEENAPQNAAARPKEFQGPKGPEPTRYGDWETKGIASDF
jgi:hypothetical protein